MSLNRLALRLAVIETLAPHALHATNTGWPTLAEGRVVDTISERLIDGLGGAKKALISVYTDAGESADRGSGVFTGESKDSAILGLEILLPVVGKAADGSPALFAQQTDAAAEALLDLIEAQVRERLLWGATEGALTQVLLEVTRITSEPQRDPDLGVQISARRVEYHCNIRQQKRLPAGQSGLARLPEPLFGVASRLTAGSAAHDLCITLAAGMASPATLADLDQMRLALAFTREQGSAAAPEISNGTGGDKQASVTF